MANMNFGVNLLPVSNKSNSLGSSSKKWNDIYVDKINGKSPIDVNALSSAMSYVVSGNKSIETVAIPAGSYVRLVGSTIAGRSDGIYTVATAIPVDTVIDGTCFNESAPIQGGGLNALNASLTATLLCEPKVVSTTAGTYSLTDSIENYLMIIVCLGANDNRTQGSNVLIRPNLRQAYNVEYGNYDVAVVFESNTSVMFVTAGPSGWYASVYGVMKLS